MSIEKEIDDLVDEFFPDSDFGEKKKKKEKTKKESEGDINTKIKEWFSHIKSIHIQVFVIDSKTKGCPKCEIWKNSKFERPFLYNFNKLIELDERNFSIEEFQCEWNYLHDLKSDFSSQIDNIKIGNYFLTQGMDIESFPSMAVYIKSDKYESGKEILKLIFEQTGESLYYDETYEIWGYKIPIRRIGNKIRFVKPLLSFLKKMSVDPESAILSLYDNVSLIFQQYHRHSNTFDN